jgi:hypothetical protein
MITPTDDELEDMTEEEYQAYLELMKQIMEIENNHALYSETADNRAPPPFWGRNRPPKKTGWTLFRNKKKR